MNEEWGPYLGQCSGGILKVGKFICVGGAKESGGHWRKVLEFMEISASAGGSRLFSNFGFWLKLTKIAR